MNAATFARISAHQPELAARLGDFHISFTIAGRVVSETIKHTTSNAAHARLDRLTDEAEEQAKGRAVAQNCKVRQRIDPETMALMAHARGEGVARRASGWT